MGEAGFCRRCGASMVLRGGRDECDYCGYWQRHNEKDEQDAALLEEFEWRILVHNIGQRMNGVKTCNGKYHERRENMTQVADRINKLPPIGIRRTCRHCGVDIFRNLDTNSKIQWIHEYGDLSYAGADGAHMAEPREESFDAKDKEKASAITVKS